MHAISKILSVSLLSALISACSSTTSSIVHSDITLDQKIRDTAQASLQAFNIPGLAVVAVQDGKVVLAEGFGIRDLANQQPVTADTLFGIASHTKAFTAAAIAQLVEQKKLDWDDKVIQHLPQFRLVDTHLTQTVTIRDLLSHRTGLGLGAGDLMIWPNTDKTSEQILAGVAQLPIAADLRQRFAYNNLMFVSAGLLIERVSGMPYAQYIAENFFQPLQMDNSVIGFDNLTPNITNIAIGNIEYAGEVQRFALDYLQDFAAAGATLSSVNDMGNWLLTLLNEGKTADGKQIIAPAQLAQMWQLTTPLPVAAKPGPQATHFRGYGMGWFVKDYHGVKHVSHSGGILGMLSLTTLIPEKNFAITVLSNQQAFQGLTTITEEALEDVLNLPDTDWLALQTKQYQAFMQEKTNFKLKPVANKTPALTQAHYAGEYQDSWYGNVTISQQAEQLHISFAHTEMLKGVLEHYDGDTFIVRWNEPLLEADAYIRFSRDNQGNINSATMEAIADFTDFSFDFHNLKLNKQP
ncbi:serine hydrolase [Rheinheimera metallidurans]|uniref:serine hydrolase n=1 Tax=Rheinheimera metallidurans TaxID=2925781 RepID=UPI003001ED13